mmetsp:Transcript_5896/g.14507  ORF Transcript_5896/g.14507 Transcript_5896/m.14507 type:complete len:836 (-) Transcript_5896:1205-3712(-)
MPLGMLAKDSMVNLAELASKMEEESQQKDAAAVGVVISGDSKTDDDDHDGDVDGTGENGANITLHVVVTGSERSNESKEAVDEESPTTKAPGSSSSGGGGGGGGGGVMAADTKAHPGGGSIRSLDSASDHNNNDVVSSEEKSDQQQQPQPQATAATMEEARAVGQYSGFSSDYHDFEHYVNHSYLYDQQPGTGVPVNLGMSVRRDDRPWWFCLFPWMEGDHMELQDETAVATNESLARPPIHGESQDETQPTPSRGSSADEDEVSTVSTSSDMFGEKLSDKDRQAVLARLRLAPPDEKQPPSSSREFDDTTQQAENPPSTPKQLQSKSDRPTRSILRRSSTIATSRESLSKSQNGKSETERTKQRRSLFPTYERKEREKKDLHTAFSPMARVVTIKSLKDMTEGEKADIWWQKSNYEEFRKTGRMIAKAMLEGGSEIWLATNQSWQTPNQGKAATLKSASTLAERHAAFKKGDRKAKIEYEDTRDKWWHKFGHSRRGLEHIASIDEGRQRQANVKASIKSVLDEQRRQKVFHREDADKLRMVSVNNTSWARDLALASGASDADAVSKNFDDESRRSREFYLLKFSRANMLNQKSKAPKPAPEKVIPAFMQPMMAMQIPANRLDAHTTSQIRFRQKQHHRTASGGDTSSSSNKPPVEATNTHHRVLSAPSAVVGDQGSAVGRRPSMRVPIQDDASTASVGSDGQPKASGKSMAKMAAGYADGVEEGDMSAVLTGMGTAGMGPPIPKAKKAATEKPGTALPKALYISTVFMMMFCITGTAAMSSSFDRHWQLYPRSYAAKRLTDSSLIHQLDGDLDKDVWKDVPFSSDFDGEKPDNI